MRWISLVLVAALACRSNDPSFRSRSGERLSDLDPLPYRVAIAKIDSQGALTGAKIPGQKESLWFALNDRGVQEFFVALLDRDPAAAEKYRVKGLRTFNETVSVTPIDLDDAIEFARGQHADLLLVPRLVEQPLFDFQRINGRWATSVALWITWIAGLFVQDREYRAVLSFEFDIINPHDGTSIATFTAVSRSIDADQWERMNKNFWTAQTAWSLILPAFWVPDNARDASRGTTSRVCARLAGQLTGYLKEDYVRQARTLTGTLQRVEPRNGAACGTEPFSFRADVVGEEPITDVAVYIDDASEPVPADRTFVDPEDASARYASLPSPPAQSRVSVYAVGIRIDDLSCVDHATRVRVEFAINGRYASQTFLYPPKSSEAK